MSIRWAIGAVVAVLTAMLVLPGIASADHHVDGSAEITCSDGTFHIEFTYDGSSSSNRSIVVTRVDDGDNDRYNGDGSGGVDSDDWHDLTIDHHEDNVDGGPDLEFDDNGGTNNDDFDVDADYTGPFTFFEVDGHYDGIANHTSDDFRIDADLSTGEDGYVYVSQDYIEDDNGGVDNWADCEIDYCLDGDANGGTALEFQASPTNDCDPVRLCVDGESVTVTEFEAETLDGDPGSCTPGDAPPVVDIPPPAPEEEVQPATETVEPSQDAVAEVSPAIDVAALPSAGYGDAGINLTWVLLFALALTGFGGATALMVRSRR